MIEFVDSIEETLNQPIHTELVSAYLDQLIYDPVSRHARIIDVHGGIHDFEGVELEQIHELMWSENPDALIGGWLEGVELEQIHELMWSENPDALIGGWL